MATNSKAQPECGTPEEYKAAYRHISDFFHAIDPSLLWRDGGQVLLVWTPTQKMFTTGTAAFYDSDLGADGTTIVGDY